MKQIWDFFLSWLFASLGWFFGGMDGVIKILLAMSIVDYLSGTLVGWSKHELSSRTGLQGIMKKCIMFTFIGIANLIDKGMLAGSELTRTAVCLFYIGNEGISLIENADKLNIPIPEFLRKRFITMQESADTEAHQEHIHLDTKKQGKE